MNMGRFTDVNKHSNAKLAGVGLTGVLIGFALTFGFSMLKNDNNSDLSREKQIEKQRLLTENDNIQRANVIIQDANGNQVKEIIKLPIVTDKEAPPLFILTKHYNKLISEETLPTDEKTQKYLDSTFAQIIKNDSLPTLIVGYIAKNAQSCDNMPQSTKQIVIDYVNKPQATYIRQMNDVSLKNTYEFVKKCHPTISANQTK